MFRPLTGFKLLLISQNNLELMSKLYQMLLTNLLQEDKVKSRQERGFFSDDDW